MRLPKARHAAVLILSTMSASFNAQGGEPNVQGHYHPTAVEERSNPSDLNSLLYQRDDRGIAPAHFLDIPLDRVPRATIIDGIPGVATPAGLGIVYEVLDCTREGYITEGEVIEHGGPLFRNLDANGDLQLSRREFVKKYHARWAPIRHSYFDQADADGDGFININDYMKHLERLVRLADTNQDGDTAWSEILALRGDGD